MFCRGGGKNSRMRKKTYEEKARAGTLKLETLRDAKLTVTDTIPKPQPYLTSAGKRIYKQICEHIRLHNTLCEIDTFYVSTIAHNYDIYQRMVKEIEKKEKEAVGSGYFQTFANGTQQNSPQLNLMSKAFDIIQKGSTALGLTVKSRDSILAFSKNATDEEGRPEDELNLN